MVIKESNYGNPLPADVRKIINSVCKKHGAIKVYWADYEEKVFKNIVNELNSLGINIDINNISCIEYENWDDLHNYPEDKDTLVDREFEWYCSILQPFKYNGELCDSSFLCDILDSNREYEVTRDYTEYIVKLFDGDVK